jgi:hypothetical protein
MPVWAVDDGNYPPMDDQRFWPIENLTHLLSKAPIIEAVLDRELHTKHPSGHWSHQWKDVDGVGGYSWASAMEQRG